MIRMYKLEIGCRARGVTSHASHPLDPPLRIHTYIYTHSFNGPLSRTTRVSRYQKGKTDLGPDLQNILRQSYDYLTIMPKLRPTYDGRLIHKTAYNEWKAFHGQDSRAKS